MDLFVINDLSTVFYAAETYLAVFASTYGDVYAI